MEAVAAWMPRMGRTNRRARAWPASSAPTSTTALEIRNHITVCRAMAVTGWVATMRRAPSLPPDQRLAYLLGFSGTLWVTTMACTLAGFLLADSVPPYVTLGLVFLNPIYFMLVLSADLKNRRRMLALVFGAAGGPPFHLLTPEWGLLITGVVAGTLAFVAGRERPVP